jgi:hypothetical protein
MINIHIKLKEKEPGRMSFIYEALSDDPSTNYEVDFAEEFTVAVREVATAIAHKHGDKTFGDVKPLQMLKRHEPVKPHQHHFDADGGPCTICGKNWGQILSKQKGQQ